MRFWIDGKSKIIKDQVEAVWAKPVNSDSGDMILLVKEGKDWLFYRQSLANIKGPARPTDFKLFSFKPFFEIGGTKWETVKQVIAFSDHQKDNVLVWNNLEWTLWHADSYVQIKKLDNLIKNLSGPAFDNFIEKLSLSDFFNFLVANSRGLINRSSQLIKSKLRLVGLSTFEKLVKEPSLKPFVQAEIRRRLEENELQRIIEAFPNENWNWRELSRNDNITWPFIQKHPEFPWDLRAANANPNITWDQIKTLDPRDIDIWIFFFNESLDWKLLKSLLENPPDLGIIWDWSILSTNLGISAKDILANQNYPWDWNYFITREDFNEPKYFEENYRNETLIRNPNLSKDFLEKHLDYYVKTQNGFGQSIVSDLSENPAIDREFIEKHPEIQDSLSERIIYNPNLDLQFFLDHLDWPSVLGEEKIDGTYCYPFTENINIDYSDILNHPEIPWDYAGISYNPNITLELILLNKDKNWNFEGISSNKFAKDKWWRRKALALLN